MTRSNITSGFKVIGIHSFNCTALFPHSAGVESQLPYIPLLSAKHHSRRRESAELSIKSFDDHDISCSPNDLPAILVLKIKFIGCTKVSTAYETTIKNCSSVNFYPSSD